MKCPECGKKLIDIRTMGEETDHLLCVGCGKEYSVAPDEDDDEPEAEMPVEAIPAHLL